LKFLGSFSGTFTLQNAETYTGSLIAFVNNTHAAAPYSGHWSEVTLAVANVQPTVEDWPSWLPGAQYVYPEFDATIIFYDNSTNQVCDTLYETWTTGPAGPLSWVGNSLNGSYSKPNGTGGWTVSGSVDPKAGTVSNVKWHGSDTALEPSGTWFFTEDITFPTLTLIGNAEFWWESSGPPVVQYTGTLAITNGNTTRNCTAKVTTVPDPQVQFFQSASTIF
jgi:hypothetical protein